MRFEICADYDEVAEKAAALVSDIIRKKPDCILGLATGSTPVGLYNRLIEEGKAGRLDFSKVQSFNLDEYYPISPDNPQSYRYFMDSHLFDHVNIDKKNTRVPNGNSTDPKEECAAYEAAIDASAGIDIQILGIGQNGHIGFNEPGTHLHSFTHLTELSESTINANARFFKQKGDVPHQALTMGIASILKAKKIVLLVTGAQKHEALQILMSGKITTSVPATLLHLHPDVTVLCDRAASDRFYLGVDIGGTDIKFGIVSDQDVLIHHESISTDICSETALLTQIATVCKKLIQQFTICGVGVGSPGTVDSLNGKVKCAGNLPFNDTDIQGYLEKELNLPVAIANDADCAALAEYHAGTGVGCRNIVMITLGTGIGSGIIINGKLYTNTQGYGSEIGHMVTHVNGHPCPCGQAGCFERYASITALVNATKEAIAAHPDSLLAATTTQKVNGKSAFIAAKQGCPIAKQVLENWFDEVAAGLSGINMIFSPDKLLLAGGITNEGEGLLLPLQKRCNNIPLGLSTLKNTAGMIGAAMLQYKEGI